LGFVGAPYTLYTYAVEGGHSGNLISSKKGLYDGRWDAFTDIMIPEVIKEMSVQAQGGADAICLFDTAAGELSQYDYESFVFPKIKAQIEGFKSEHPETRIVYYSKFTHTQYLTPLFDLPIDVFGVDWRHDLAETQKLLPKDRYIQGNIDPAWLHLEWNDLKANLNNYKKHLDSLDMDYSRWIFGLGHGVTIQTPEENVRNTVKWVEENLLY
jgi:uroporphyrinogen decarboxylase